MYEDNEVTVMASDKDLKRLKLCFSLYNPQKTLTKLLIDQSYAALCDPHAPLSMEFSRQEYSSEFSSVQSLSSVWLFATPWTAAHQAFLSITNSQSPHKPIPLSQWCHPTTSSSVVPFSSCLQSFPVSGSFPMGQFFTLGGQSISASASLLLMNIQGWFHLGLIGWISLQSKGISRLFSNTTVEKHQFFSAQLSL